MTFVLPRDVVTASRFNLNGKTGIQGWKKGRKSYSNQPSSANGPIHAPRGLGRPNRRWCLQSLSRRSVRLRAMSSDTSHED